MLTVSGLDVPVECNCRKLNGVSECPEVKGIDDEDCKVCDPQSGRRRQVIKEMLMCSLRLSSRAWTWRRAAGPETFRVPQDVSAHDVSGCVSAGLSVASNSSLGIDCLVILYHPRTPNLDLSHKSSAACSLSAQVLSSSICRAMQTYILYVALR